MFSIILPTYNEAPNIRQLLERLRRLYPQEEMIVVDDNSPDLSWKIAQEVGLQDKNLKVLRRMKGRGLVNSLKEGIGAAREDILVWMDCDFSMPPETISGLVGPLSDSYDMVVGSRYVEGAKDGRDFKIRVFSSLLINGLARLILGTRTKDLTSGFIAVRRKVLDKVGISGVYGEYFIELVAKAEAAGFKIKEIPYSSVSRLGGQTKTAPNFFTFLIISLRYFLTIFRLALSKAV